MPVIFDNTGFLRQIGPSNAALIRHLRFNLSFDWVWHSWISPTLVQKILDSLPEIRMLEVITFTVVCSFEAHSVFYREVMPYLEPLRKLTGIKKIIFIGDVPEAYARGLRRDMGLKN